MTKSVRWLKVGLVCGVSLLGSLGVIGLSHADDAASAEALQLQKYLFACQDAMRGASTAGIYRSSKQEGDFFSLAQLNGQSGIAAYSATSGKFYPLPMPKDGEELHFQLTSTRGEPVFVDIWGEGRHMATWSQSDMTYRREHTLEHGPVPTNYMSREAYALDLETLTRLHKQSALDRLAVGGVMDYYEYTLAENLKLFKARGDSAVRIANQKTRREWIEKLFLCRQVPDRNIQQAVDDVFDELDATQAERSQSEK